MIEPEACDGNCEKCQTCRYETKPVRSVGAVGSAGKIDNFAEAYEYDAAVDVGTTTIAMALVNRQGGIGSALTKNNSQRKFGADVLSRIRYANAGNAEELKHSVWHDIIEGIDELKKHGVQIKRLVISANTTMEHLIMGDSCAGLGTAPFTPATVKLREQRLCSVWSNVPEGCEDTILTVLPGISAFIGADTVMGMYALGMEELRENSLFIDLGTNGEMVLSGKSGFLAASVAAGPAFEGGNITWGTPGIDGAVSGISLPGGRTVLQTIGDIPPVGICGSGVLELAYEMIKNGLADRNGNFIEEYRVNGFPVAKTADGREIVFTQSDMRELQMAKAAVRSGIELLMEEKGLMQKDIGQVYLAGGFGYQVNPYKAAAIGLLPRELRDKTKAVGNTSLQGAIRYLSEKNAANHLKQMIAAASEINLANHPAFEERYLGAMNF